MSRTLAAIAFVFLAIASAFAWTHGKPAVVGTGDLLTNAANGNLLTNPANGNLLERP